MDFSVTRSRNKNHQPTVKANKIGVLTLGSSTQVEQISRSYPDTKAETIDQVAHEEVFFRMTKIRASRPARIGLRRLFKENFTVREVRCLWAAKALQFADSRFVLDTSVIWRLVFCFAAKLLLPTIVVVALWLDGFISRGESLTALVLIWGTFGAISEAQMRQRYICPLRRMRTVIDKVNADLPELLSDA